MSAKQSDVDFSHNEISPANLFGIGLWSIEADEPSDYLVADNTIHHQPEKWVGGIHQRLRADGRRGRTTLLPAPPSSCKSGDSPVTTRQFVLSNSLIFGVCTKLLRSVPTNMVFVMVSPNRARRRNLRLYCRLPSPCQPN